MTEINDKTLEKLVDTQNRMIDTLDKLTDTLMPDEGAVCEPLDSEDMDNLAEAVEGFILNSGILFPIHH